MSDLLPLEGAALATDGALPISYNPEEDPYRVYLDRLDSDTSRYSVQGRLDRIAQIILMDETGTATGTGLPWGKLRYTHTARIRAHLRDKKNEDGTPAYSPSTVNNYLSALRQVLREAWRLGQMNAEEYERAADLEGIQGTRLARRRHIEDNILGAALAACEADKKNRRKALRDGALLGALFTTGMRRAEASGLMIEDYQPAARSFRVLGKRNKERLVYLTVEAAERVDTWIEARGRTPGGFFPPVSSGGNCRVKNGRFTNISGQGVSNVLTGRLAEAGADRFTPHDLRSKLIGALLDAGVDLSTAQEIAGHADPRTTQLYDVRPDRRRREAVDKITLPPARPLKAAAEDGA
jgi:site-specific recombinase XerD